MNNLETDSIKSLNIRYVGLKNKQLMDASMVTVFESFLKETIGQEVLVVNTNIGIGVYYCANTNYNMFVRESILLFLISDVDTKRVRYRSNNSKEEVYQSFCEALVGFSQNPQVFLAYAKKFRKIQERNKSSAFVVPILNGFFEEVLEELVNKGTMPHYEKIKRLGYTVPSYGTNQKIIQELIAEILLKKHYN